jgi:hypothetical protein
MFSVKFNPAVKSTAAGASGACPGSVSDIFISPSPRWRGEGCLSTIAVLASVEGEVSLFFINSVFQVSGFRFLLRALNRVTPPAFYAVAFTILLSG